ncbi:plastocyanin/azurin family copper-binding protein [Ideonella sp. DXS29W]|uniref:Plastocyanin/azurin family copper-binding protein n=1 Tax=Ideonella lacteola TaxID=2984193 RepID=A0ABU9BUM6_9BURK
MKLLPSPLHCLAIGAALFCPVMAQAAEHLVVQKDKAFSVKTLSVKAGDKIVFRNDDSFSHNIFSLTDAQPFDLGTYGNGQSKSVTYAKPGKYEVECAIHPDMRLVVTVTP